MFARPNFTRLSRLFIRPEIWILAIASAITRLVGLSRPNAVVFDEVYFKGFAGHYLDHQYFFDIHPPLAKLIFAGWAHFFHISAAHLNNDPVASLRILPALAGAMLVVVIYGILRRLHTSRAVATLGASLVLLDNALVVESRFILMDTMLLATAFGAVWAYLSYRQATTESKRWLYIILAAILAGLAISIKWTALASLALIWLMFAYDSFRQHKQPKPIRIWQTLTRAFCLVAIPVLIYLSCFWLHFNLLTHSGPGDAFMTPRFQASLEGSTYHGQTSQLSFWSKFRELNVEMYHASATLTASHPYGSAWYSWPLELRPVYYWQGSIRPDGRQGNIYLLGNPFIWWGLGLGLVISLIGLNHSWVKHLRPVRYGLAITALAYLMNYLPFVGVTRVMFLYHYFFSFIWSIIFLCLLVGGRLGWNQPGDKFAFSSKRSAQLFWSVVGVALICFIVFAPITYGWLLKPSQLNWLFWLPSWR